MLLVLLALGTGSTAFAEGETTRTRPNAEGETTRIRPHAEGETTWIRPNQDWRARGLAYIDLPLQLRARFDAHYSKYGSPVDHLAAPHAAALGPELRFERHIESRVALTRPLWQGIELEVAWQTRNRVEAGGDLMGFGRQVVGAQIRITP